MRLDTAPRRCRVFGAVTCEIVSIIVPPDNYLPGNGARRGRGAALDATGHQGRRVESAEGLDHRVGHLVSMTTEKTNDLSQGAVPLSRETGSSPWEEGRDTQG